MTSRASPRRFRPAPPPARAIRKRRCGVCICRSLTSFGLMTLPSTNYEPPFNITRASHVVLTARDLEASRAFYADVLGFIVTEIADGALYLRGLAERAHHSITIRPEAGRAACRPSGLRLVTDPERARAAE